MIKYFISFLSLIPTLLFSQNYRFNIDYDSGSITNTYILDSKTIVSISETINEVYLFSTSSEAKNYFINLHKCIKPRHSFQINETTIYTDSLSSIEYYTNNIPTGQVGKIKSINGTLFSYTPNYSYNRNNGTVGKIAKIGETKITYWTGGSYTTKGKHIGKIKSFGAKQFNYEGWSSWGEKANMVGKITSIGTLKVNYYETDYDRGFKGKIKSIGKVSFEYYKMNSVNQKADIVGKFKQQTGTDSRAIIR